VKRRWTPLPVILAVAAAYAAVTITNVTMWGVGAANPPLAKIAGRDRGDPAYNVKRASAYWSSENGLNVTYVEVIVPRCHRTVFDPILNVSTPAPIPVKLYAESVTGAHSSQLSATIALSGSTQVVVTSGSITQASGNPVTVDGQAGFKLEVLVGSGAPLGAEVARLNTWLYFNYSSAKVRQKIVWVFKTWPQPPRVTLFYDGFESGSLQGWTRTTYTYVEQKNYDVTVIEYCYVPSRPPTPNPITDTTRPVGGSWLAWIGFREQVRCEPRPALDDYLRRTVSVPSMLDGVEVKYVNVTFWWRMLTWDSAIYDYINLSLAKGSNTYYWKQRYNPNPGYSYGPFRDTGWQRNSTLFSGVSGSSVTITFLLHTYSDEYYRSWLYIDEVHFEVVFDCVSQSVDPALSVAPLSAPHDLTQPLSVDEGRGAPDAGRSG